MKGEAEPEGVWGGEEGGGGAGHRLLHQRQRVCIYLIFKLFIFQFLVSVVDRDTVGHRVSTSREEKGGKGDASSLKLNLTDPCHTVLCQYHCLGMLGRQAGSTVLVYARVQCLRAQNRAAKGSILKEDEILCQSCYIIYLCGGVSSIQFFNQSIQNDAIRFLCCMWEEPVGDIQNNFYIIFIQYYSMICRPSDHTVGRPRAEIRTRAGRLRGRDTTPRPPHLLYRKSCVHICSPWLCWHVASIDVDYAVSAEIVIDYVDTMSLKSLTLRTRCQRSRWLSRHGQDYEMNGHFQKTLKTSHRF